MAAAAGAMGGALGGAMPAYGGGYASPVQHPVIPLTIAFRPNFCVWPSPTAFLSLCLAECSACV